MFVRTLLALAAIILLGACSTTSPTPNLAKLPPDLRAAASHAPRACDGKVPVVVVTTDEKQAIFYGHAFIKNREMIAISTALYNSPERDFVLAHECAHKMLVGRNLHPHLEELVADCHATKKMLAAKNSAAIKAFMAYIANHPATATHPSGEARIANVANCAKNAVADLKAKVEKL